MIKVRRKLHFVRRERGRQVLTSAPPCIADGPAGRIPRVSRLMALAIHFDRLLREGEVKDQSELARLAHVTQPRMTQIMNLNHLSPDIQEELLFLPRVTKGRDPVNERLLRPIAAEASWERQRELWRRTRLGQGFSAPDKKHLHAETKAKGRPRAALSSHALSS